MQERGPASPVDAEAGGGTGGRRWLLSGAVAAAVVAADQLAKTWAVRTLDDHDIHLVWTLRLHLTFNSGGSFSLGSGNPWFFVGAGAVLLVVLLAFGHRMAGPLTAVAVGLIVGGALGNLGDRVFRDTGGAVVDFIDPQWWPIFNVADAAIVCGGILLLLAGREQRGS